MSSAVPYPTEGSSTVSSTTGGDELLTVFVLHAAEGHVLTVVGEADLHTAPRLRRELIAALVLAPPSVLVELGALEFCDLQGLDALHDVAQVARDLDVAITFRGMSRLLTMMDREFPPADPAQSLTGSRSPDPHWA